MVLESSKTLLHLFVPVVFLLPYFAVSKIFYDDEWDGSDKHTRDWCHRLRRCIPENRTVCGWDEEAEFLAQFENICIFYRANCRGAGKYVEVEMIVCDIRKNYSLTHPDGGPNEFEWIHIDQGTSAATTGALGLHANNSALRSQAKFVTMYEGLTLPPDFFANDSRNTTKAVTNAKSKTIPSDAIHGRILDLLWRKSAGVGFGFADKLSDNITRK